MVACYGMREVDFPACLQRVKDYHLGACFLFGASSSVIASWVSRMQKASKVPLLFGGDYEMGTGQMVKDGVSFPRAMARGWGSDKGTEYEIGAICGRQGRSMGVNITMSPVLDVNTDRLCADVNIRAYSDDPDIVARRGVQYAKGVQDNGMLACAKHFPAGGASGMDQHVSTALVTDSRNAMKRLRLAPYARAMREADLAAIMVAHLEVPSLTKEKNPRNGRAVPTSVSREVITGVLRGAMGFKGLVITDALNMGGITTQYTREEASVKAINAGIDMLLQFNPDEIDRDYGALLDAAKSGELPRRRLDEAVRSVLRAKLRLGLDRDGGAPAPAAQRRKLFAPGQYEALRRRVAEKAVTVLTNKGKVLPIRKIRGKKVAVIKIYAPETKRMREKGQRVPADVVGKLLRKQGARVKEFELSAELSHGDIAAVHRAAASSDYVFMNFFVIPSWGEGSLMPSAKTLGLFYFGILTCGAKVVITSFGDPWAMHNYHAAPVTVFTFNESAHSQEAAVKVWLGENRSTGRMPVELEGIFKRGDGMDIG